MPPRLHVLLASLAPIGVVFRRGPSKQVCTVLWARQQDTFSLGQWFKGRIYERRSDLSPDGRYLVYFAMNGHWQSETRGSWTAISRAPYLRAIALYAKGDCWNGGGLFTGNRRVWLNDGYGHKPLQTSNEIEIDRNYQPKGGVGGECPGVYYPRLLRDGWTFLGTTGSQFDQIDRFEKPAGQGWVLRKLAHAQLGAPPGKGCYWDEHELFHLETGTCLPQPDWEWADLDGNRLVWAAAGCLHTATLTRTGLTNSQVLHDFTAMTFEPIPAPY